MPVSPEGSTNPRFRWGLLDALAVWLGGLFVGGFVGVLLGDTVDGEFELTTAAFAGVVLVQNAAMFGGTVIVSRFRGSGSLHRDFGLDVTPRDAGWLLVGLALQLVALVALLPIAELAGLDDAPQEAVQRLEQAGGLELAVLAFGVVIVAPVVEELLFRGLLLRSLLRRTTPAWAVTISAGLFGLVHLADPGAAVVVPGLVALGLLTGVEATRTGSLSRPILLHAGFNLLTVVVLVF